MTSAFLFLAAGTLVLGIFILLCIIADRPYVQDRAVRLVDLSDILDQETTK